MSKKTKEHLVPQLRFPEFRDDGDWVEKRLDEISMFKKGKSVSKNDIVDNGKLECIRYGELYTCYSEVINIIFSKTNLPISSLVLSKKNDVIIPSSGETQLDIATASCVMKDGIALGGDLNVIRSDANGIFLSYCLNSSMRHEIAKLAQGNTVVHLYNNQLKALSIKFPFPPEQTKIANCLSSIDELITGQTKKLNSFKQHKKGLMQKLFPTEGKAVPKLRFPEFVSSEEWRIAVIGSVVSKDIKWSFTGGPFGSNLKSSDYTEKGIRIIQLQNIGDGKFLDDYEIFTSEEKANELLSSNIYPGEIILSKMGDPVARACFIPEDQDRCLMCSDGIRLVVDKSKFDAFFVYSLINSTTFRRLAESSSTGSTRKRIGIDVLRKLALAIPQLTEQQKIAACLSSIDELITTQTKKLDSLKQHKKGLMQKLFPIIEDPQI
ncbi:MAG: hypothetical protein GY821_08765 [Gammaproteobacteria bacterium]|nr:hypothetical protein [Gammaproteobacteria bacterium]